VTYIVDGDERVCSFRALGYLSLGLALFFWHGKPQMYQSNREGSMGGKMDGKDFSTRQTMNWRFCLSGLKEGKNQTVKVCFATPGLQTHDWLWVVFIRIFKLLVEEANASG